MNNKRLQVIVGLAIKNSLYNRRINQRLFDIYTNPNLQDIKALYDRLIISDNHFDRELAFWLELALDQKPLNVNMRDILLELTQIEVLLHDILRQVDTGSQHDLNDWLNYIANVPQSLREGYGIDAKILMSLAEKTCKTRSIEKIKKNPNLGYKIAILQKETFRLYKEINKLPLDLAIPTERLNAIIKLQELVIDLLHQYYLDQPCDNKRDLMRYVIRKLETAQKRLMRENVGLTEVKKEINSATERLEWQINQKNIENKTLEWAENLLPNIITCRNLIT